LLANHKEDWIKVDGIATPVKVEPGQFITGRYAFHKAMFPKPCPTTPEAKTTERWLQTLKMLGNVSIKTSNKFSLVTIVNWDIYQGNNVQQNVPEMSSRCPADVQQMSTNKNVKNDKNIDVPSPEIIGSSFEDYRHLLKNASNPVGFLVTCFKKLHADATEEDLRTCGGRLGKMWSSQGKDAGYLLKLIWNSSSQGIAGSHLNYIEGMLKKTPAPVPYQSKYGPLKEE